MKLGRQDWATPRAFLNLFAPFHVDLAAHADNFRFEPWCGPGSPHGFVDHENADEWVPFTNSLALPWAKLFGDKCAWLNPPFADIEPWVKKCVEETENYAEQGMINVLVPAALGTRWWERYVNGIAQVNIIRPRLTFEGATAPYMGKDLCLLAYTKVRHEPNRYRIFDVGRNDGAYRKTGEKPAGYGKGLNEK